MKRTDTTYLPSLLRLKQTDNSLNSMTRFRRYLRKTFLRVTVIEMGYQGEKSPYLDVFKNRMYF